MTVVLNALPAVAFAGAVTVSVVAAAASTVICRSSPLIEPVTVSVAVTVWLPAVRQGDAFVNVCTPLSPPMKV